MGSWNSLVEQVGRATLQPSPREVIGREQLAFMSGMLDRAVDFRSAHPELEHRWLDVSYYDLLRDPMAVVGEIYERCGWSLEPDAVDAMDAWLEEQGRRRRSEKRHRYDIADYGLNREMVDAAFSRYRDFVSQRGIQGPGR